MANKDKPRVEGSKERIPRNIRESLNSWFPTVVRYMGVALVIYIALIDKGQNPALIPTAMGLILFKTVYGKDD